MFAFPQFHCCYILEAIDKAIIHHWTMVESRSHDGLPSFELFAQ